MAKSKKDPITFRTKALRGKVVEAQIDGEAVAEVVKLSASKQKPVYLTSDPTNPEPHTTVRVHRTEDKAVRRFSKRFPVITTRLRKKL